MLDSTELHGTPGALADRFRRDGYLLLRGVLDADLVRAAGDTGYAHLSMGGWLQRSTGAPREAAPALPVRARNVRDALGDPGFRQWLASPAFNRLSYDGALPELIDEVLGSEAFPYPMKVPRAVYPSTHVATHNGNQLHRDVGNWGARDMVTAWVPLVDVPWEMGGLGVIPGSHRQRQPDPAAWVSTHYEVGDVVIHHCLTMHASGNNNTDRMRLSGEYRWQYADDPVPWRAIYGLGTPRTVELFSLLLRREPWWRPAPEHLTMIANGAPIDVAGILPSRYMAGEIGPTALGYRPDAPAVAGARGHLIP